MEDLYFTVLYIILLKYFHPWHGNYLYESIYQKMIFVFCKNGVEEKTEFEPDHVLNLSQKFTLKLRENSKSKMFKI